MRRSAPFSRFPACWIAGLLLLLTLLGGCGGESPEPLAITSQPTDVVTLMNAEATLSVATNRSDATYQWQVSADAGATWSDIGGATSDSFTTLATIGGNVMRYRVVVSAGGTSITSSVVTITAVPRAVLPVITVSPASITVTEPANAVFSVVATGSALAYVWQRSTDAGATWANIGGATASATFDTGPTTVAMSGDRFRVVVGNLAGAVVSAEAILTVLPPPVASVLTTQPAIKD